MTRRALECHGKFHFEIGKILSQFHFQLADFIAEKVLDIHGVILLLHSEHIKLLLCTSNHV